MRYRPFVIYPGDSFYQEAQAQIRRTGHSPVTHLLLFLATVLTTIGVGSVMAGKNPFAGIPQFFTGVPFSIAILSILGIHEFAHYFAARAWGIRVTLPYFIPAPVIPIGTFGAVIVMKSAIPTRKALIDIGTSGPLAGFVVSVIACIIGLRLTVAVPPDAMAGGIILGESLLFKLLGALFLTPAPEGYIHVLHPIAYAGWLGLFVTALNLIPIGQLDGGHVLFALSPRVHDLMRRIRIPLLLLMGLSFWNGWYVWAVLSLFFGRAHPYPDHMDTGVGPARIALAVAAIAVFVLCLMLTPISLEVTA